MRFETPETPQPVAYDFDRFVSDLQSVWSVPSWSAPAVRAAYFVQKYGHSDAMERSLRILEQSIQFLVLYRDRLTTLSIERPAPSFERAVLMAVWEHYSTAVQPGKVVTSPTVAEIKARATELS